MATTIEEMKLTVDYPNVVSVWVFYFLLRVQKSTGYFPMLLQPGNIELVNLIKFNGILVSVYKVNYEF